MSQKAKIFAGVAAIILGAVAIGWIYFQLSPSAWDQFLDEMSGDTSPSGSEPRVASRRPSRSSGDLMASGSIEADEITLAAEVGGRIVEVGADEGDEVAGGSLLLEVDQEALLAQREGALAIVDQAQAALDASQAQLNQALAGAAKEDIAAAEAAVLAAEGSVAAAESAVTQAEVGAGSARTVDQVESSVAMAEANLSAAEGAIAAAEADLARANAESAQLQAGARPEVIASYVALLAQAEAQYQGAKNVYDDLAEKGVGGVPEEQARFQMQAAEEARNAAQAQLALAQAGPSVEEIAAAAAIVQAALAQVDIANAGKEAAEAALTQSQAGPVTSLDLVAQADAGILVAQAQVKVAEGLLAQTQAALDRLMAGATDEEIAILEAQVSQAEAALTTAEASLKSLDIELNRSRLLAPSGGVIMERMAHEGELAIPGAALFTLADLDEVTLTVFVPEAELGKVYLGQKVEVAVDAYDEMFPGQVSYIASQAEFTPKNVQTQEERVHMVFAVKIRLENFDHLLKPGMPADSFFASD